MAAPRCLQLLGPLLLLAAAAVCAMGMDFGMGGGDFGFAGPNSGGSGLSVPGTAASKSDVKYIKCEVCGLLAKQAYRQVKAAEKALKPGKKVRHLFSISM